MFTKRRPIRTTSACCVYISHTHKSSSIQIKPEKTSEKMSVGTLPLNEFSEICFCFAAKAWKLKASLHWNTTALWIWNHNESVDAVTLTGQMERIKMRLHVKQHHLQPHITKEGSALYLPWVWVEEQHFIRNYHLTLQHHRDVLVVNQLPVAPAPPN